MDLQDVRIRFDRNKRRSGPADLATVFRSRLIVLVRQGMGTCPWQERYRKQVCGYLSEWDDERGSSRDAAA